MTDARRRLSVAAPGFEQARSDATVQDGGCWRQSAGAGQRRDRPGAGRSLEVSAPQQQLPQHGQLRHLARRLPQAGRGQRHLARHHLGRARRHDARPRHHRPRPPAKLLRPEFHGVRRQADLTEPPAIGGRAPQEARGSFRQGRPEVRRAGPGDRRLLGAGERLRRGHGQSARAALARDSRLRLPPARDVPRRADGCAAHHRPRRLAA